MKIVVFSNDRVKVKQKCPELTVCFGSQLVDFIEELDAADVKLDSYINYITNFDKWTMHHYYAMKNREKYPNMFFYYFPTSLFQISKIEEQDKSKVIDYILKTDEKKLNGRWGYLSLILENANVNGEQLYNSISNNRAIINFSNSFPLKEDAKPDFDKPAEICPTCGQRLTEKQIADNMKRFNDRMTAWQEKHDAKIKQITYDGKQASANVKKYRERSASS